MTRAERALSLTASLHVLNRLRAFARLSRYEEQRRAAMAHERVELLRQMGASERREYERLKQEWERT